MKLGEATESPTFPYDVQGLDTGSYQLRAEAFDAVGTHVGDAVQTIKIVEVLLVEGLVVCLRRGASPIFCVLGPKTVPKGYGESEIKASLLATCGSM